MKTKVIYALIAVVLMATASFASTSAFDIQWWNANIRTNSPSNTLKQWAEGMEGRAGYNPGTGKIWYVDSNVSNEGDGTSWTNAKDTLDEAINLCTTGDCNDIIYIAPKSTFTMGAAADEVDVDVENITIIGLGEGRNMPTFDYTGDVTGAFAIGNDNITIINCRFLANVTDVNEAIEVEAGSTGVSIVNCLFEVNTAATDEFLHAINSNAAGNHYLNIIGCEFDMGGGGATTAMLFRDADYARIVGNRFAGDYSTAAVNNATTASDHILIKDNVITNGTIGGAAGLNTEPCIELKSDTSGVIVNNYLICNVANPSAAIVGDDCWLLNNWYSESEGSENVAPMWLTQPTSDTTDAVDMTPEIPDNSILANILDDGGDTSAYDRRYHSLLALNTDLDAIIADTVVADTNGIWNDAPRVTADTTSAMTAGNGYTAAADPAIFTVTGDILCKACCHITTQITSTSSDTLELGVAGNTAALLVQDVADGTAFDAGDDWSLITAADASGAQLADEWLFIGGGDDIKLYIDDHDLTAGVATFYLFWIPLSTDAAVVGAAP